MDALKKEIVKKLMEAEEMASKGKTDGMSSQQIKLWCDALQSLEAVQPIIRQQISEMSAREQAPMQTQPHNSVKNY